MKRWTEKEVRDLAKNYPNQTQFRYAHEGAWCHAYRNGYLHDIFGEANKQFNELRCIYAYEDEENKYVYVGLTKNLKYRHQQHKCCKNHRTGLYDSVKRYFDSLNKELPQPKLLEEKLTPKQAQIQEDYWKNRYIEDDWNIINKAKTGLNTSSLGYGKVVWTDDYTRKMAATCKTRQEFHDKFKSARKYKEVIKILDEVLPTKNALKQVDKETLFEIRKQYNTGNEWRKSDYTTWYQAFHLGLIHYFYCEPKEYTKQDVFNVLCFYSSFSDFLINRPKAFRYALNNNFLNEIKRFYGISENEYTKENVFEESKKYKDLRELYNKNFFIYKLAYNYGIHTFLYRTRKAHVKDYTDEELINFLKKFKNRTAAYKASTLRVREAKKRGLLDLYLPNGRFKSNKKI